MLLATAASSLMQTFLTVSLPTVTAELDAIAWYGWVTGIYLATATLSIPPWAILSDRIGPRTVHVAGMSIWALGTWTVALADSATWLLVARAVQGIGAAAVVPAGFAAITVVYHDRYGRLIGLMGAVQASVTLAGGPLGGWLGGWLGWRDSLHIVALIAGIPILLGWFTLPTTRQPAARRPARLLRSPPVRHAVAQTMLLAVIAFGLSTYLPLLLQSQFQLDLARTALLATPTLIGVAIGSVVGGIVAERRDTTHIAWLTVLSGLLFAWIPIATVAAAGSAIAAAGVGIGLPSQLIAVERIATTAHASKAGGTIQGARNIGGALGVALLGIPLQLGATSETGAQCAFAMMLGLACLVSLAGLVARKRQRDG
ncbi:MFS transporter [Micropruina sp.]|uniref:MFS transporter n=1 Tax=Micropruina sp. TaxID=2737536 RepID=UPI0039E2F678